MPNQVLSPSDFVAILNQTLEVAYPMVIIEGELSNFRVSKNRWVYFDLQDDNASVKFFGTVYNLPGPLEDGLKVQVIGYPRMHPRFGFSINIQTIAPVGAGSIKKAADLLRAKLEAEGLFDVSRKRVLPRWPKNVALITAANSAAYADFVKIMDERWGGVDIHFSDVYVQGTKAPLQIVKAIEHFNRLPVLPDVLVVTRGGGSAEDLAWFNDERVVRAVAASRIPTLVAVGHEVDIILAELAADLRASTPSNAAQLLVPDRTEIIAELAATRSKLTDSLVQSFELTLRDLQESRRYLTSKALLYLDNLSEQLESRRKIFSIFDPRSALRRGYAVIRSRGRHINSVAGLTLGELLQIQLADGTITAKTEEINT
ncbi:MAG TPA: exodeoxyribonuclease VII large subunit [Candidatus Babeliales bacterium]|nr:exodeoxyribonuclease VII large subunit [Candidatus Babeliales bacterium]